jgi:hypothetical protein
LKNQLNSLRTAIGMRRKIGLLKSNLAGSPLVLGVFRSSLVVPAFLISGLSTDQ